MNNPGKNQGYAKLSHNLRLIVILLLMCCSVNDFTANAATIDANSCSLADVKTAYTTASAGDTVAIPAGNCAWAGQLAITKSITIIGAGGSNTKVTRGSFSNSLIDITLSSDVPVRISGIYFEQGPVTGNAKVAVFVNGKKDGSFGYTKIRIDHNTFNKGTNVIWVNGWAYGVADHNQFINCDTGVIIVGDYSYAWSRPIEAGTANAFFIEDNTFTINNDIERTPNEQIYHQSGGRSVTRMNTVDGRQYTKGHTLFVDSHGNWGATGGLNYRGQPIIEVYNNDVRVYQSYRFIHIRGGSSLIYNNSMTSIGSAANPIMLSEEESWQTALFNPLKTTWPAEDQINNSFFFKIFISRRIGKRYKYLRLTQLIITSGFKAIISLANLKKDKWLTL